MIVCQDSRAISSSAAERGGAKASQVTTGIGIPDFVIGQPSDPLGDHLFNLLSSPRHDDLNHLRDDAFSVNVALSEGRW
jgi:hypothetical protein